LSCADAACRPEAAMFRASITSLFVVEIARLV